jgi:hypothetical protein
MLIVVGLALGLLAAHLATLARIRQRRRESNGE